MSHELVQIIEQGYRDWNAGDMEAVRNQIHPDFTWQEAPEVPGQGKAENRDEFERYMRSFGRVWDEFSFHPQELIDAGQTVVAIVVAKGVGKVSGARVALKIVHVWSFRDTKTISMHAYFDRGKALEEAGVEDEALTL